MSRLVLAALIILLTAKCSTGFFFGSDALVLTEANFAEAIAENNYILVMFYSPRCGYSRKLLPNFDSAASILSGEDSPIKLAKIDASEEVALRKTHHIRKYPTLKLFIHGRPTEYASSTVPTYNLSPQEIINWVKEHIGDQGPALPAGSPVPEDDHGGANGDL